MREGKYTYILYTSMSWKSQNTQLEDSWNHSAQLRGYVLNAMG